MAAASFDQRQSASGTRRSLEYSFSLDGGQVAGGGGRLDTELAGDLADRRRVASLRDVAANEADNLALAAGQRSRHGGSPRGHTGSVQVATASLAEPIEEEPCQHNLADRG